MRQCAGLIGGWGLRALGLLYARGNRQQHSQLSDIVCAGAIGEEAVMADAVQALGQDVHQQPANELVGIERHRCVPAGSLDPVVHPWFPVVSYDGSRGDVMGSEGNRGETPWHRKLDG